MHTVCSYCHCRNDNESVLLSSFNNFKTIGLHVPRIDTYEVIHNSLTHYKKLVHLNGVRNGNMRHTNRKRNSLSLFCIPHKCSMCLPLQGLRWNASLTCSTLSSKGPGQPACLAIHRNLSHWSFSYHCFMLFFTSGFFPNLVRKRCCTVTIDCSGILKNALFVSPF
jgi:hypothetical protein